MKIKLLSREIALLKVDKNSKQLNTKDIGRVLLYDNEIYFDGSDPFSVLLHEIMHMYLSHTGNDRRSNYVEEDLCDVFGKAIEQLLLENGDNIIKQLKEFANED